jgi:hypothetical protein
MASIWISRVDLEDMIGEEAAEALLTEFSGRRIYIPAKVESEKFSPIIGSVANEILSREFRGYEVCLPSLRKTPTKKERIITMLEAGHSADEIAVAAECSLRHVAYCKQDAGLTQPTPRKKRTQNPR